MHADPATTFLSMAEHRQINARGNNHIWRANSWKKDTKNKRVATASSSALSLAPAARFAYAGVSLGLGERLFLSFGTACLLGGSVLGSTGAPKRAFPGVCVLTSTRVVACQSHLTRNEIISAGCSPARHSRAAWRFHRNSWSVSHSL